MRKRPILTRLVPPPPAVAAGDDAIYAGGGRFEGLGAKRNLLVFTSPWRRSSALLEVAVQAPDATQVATEGPR